ncbi:MAG: hypothetical protein DWQ07_22955 [Chloroflexi bacterium]|nr:MAG: hypothetical protein DWQ07_22955 [Chloroflexota bacterium]MBL1194008.1 hypothetical protein [Chloroflexota bacterium]NOH11302.1 hypothetical protein [Chloroflexota bacterium]
MDFLEIDTQPTPLTGEFPYFINDVLPQPDSKMSFAEYEDSRDGFFGPLRGIMIETFAEVYDGIYHAYPQVASENVILILDGNLISNQLQEAASGILGGVIVDPITGEPTGELYDAGPFWISWNLKLRPGVHTAEVWIKTEAGEILAYRWEFEIVR